MWNHHYVNLLLILQAKVDGRLVERATLYSILHTCKDGSAINPVAQAKMVSNPFHIQGIVVLLKNGDKFKIELQPIFCAN